MRPALSRTRELVKPCSPDGKRCATASDPRKATPACCVAHNVTVLIDVVAALHAAGIPWWIDYGMLLGYCVDGGFYWNDKDVDLGCMAEDRERVFGMIPVWEEQGHGVSYTRPVAGKPWACFDLLKIAISPKNTNKVDIAFWHRREDNKLDREAWCDFDKFKGREMPESWVFPTVPGTWEGIAVNLPAEPELLVAHRYGENWRKLPPRRHDSKRR